MRHFTDNVLQDPYPFGSELYTDQTAHNQVYAFLRYYGHGEAAERVLQATKALRAGAAPSWYR